MYIWDIITPSSYRKWNIMDLWDYLTDYYNDMAQEDPIHYAARIPIVWYDLKQPLDLAYLNTYGIKKDDVWYYADNESRTKYVSIFKHLTAIWRSDLDKNGKYKIQYVSPQRNDYIISAGAFIQILRERYADFSYLTSYKFNYKTGKREFPKNISEAATYLLDTLRVWKHDKQDALTKLMFALRKDYDPVENYDKTSEIEVEFKGSEIDKFTPSGKIKVELKQEGAELHTMERGAQTVTDSKTTYDSATFNDTDRTSANAYTDKNVDKYGVDANGNNNPRKDTTTTSFENDRNDKNWKRYGYDEDGHADARKNVTKEHTHGNIGVTTSQQMIQSQFPIEYYDEIERYTVNEFVHKCLVLA